MDNLRDRLLGAGYVARRRELLAVAALLSHRNGGAPTLLLEGPPGAGKTALGEALAKSHDWPLVYAQLHAWTDSDELFVGVDVAAAVAGDAAHVRQDGVLARAARLSREHQRVVLVLDEVDKCQERTEALLLDFLQSGRVPLAPGQHLQANLSRLVVLLTSNAQRDLSDALLRRCRRVRVDPLPVELLDQLVLDKTGAPKGVVTLVSRACRGVAQTEGSHLSMQEIAHATREICELAEAASDVREILAAWAARTPEGVQAIDRDLVAAIWGECRKGARAA